MRDSSLLSPPAAAADPVAAAGVGRVGGGLLRAAWARFRRCSGISVMGVPPGTPVACLRVCPHEHSSVRLRRSRRPARASETRRVSGVFGASEATHNGPEIPPSFRTRQKWTAMKMTMTNGSSSTCSTYHRSKRLRPDLSAAEEDEPHLLAEDRRVPHHVRADGDGPQGELVPRQQVAGERQQQSEHQQDHADHPVELTRRLVGAVVEDARHVEEHRQHHQVGAPAVHVADQQPERHRRLQVGDVVPRRRRLRPVEEHQEDAGDGQQDEQEEAEPTEAQRVADLDRVALHLDRVQVVQHRVHDHVAAVARAVGVALAEDRAGPEDAGPGLAALHRVDGLVETVLERRAGPFVDRLGHQTAFPGHAMYCLRSVWTLARWRSLARIVGGTSIPFRTSSRRRSRGCSCGCVSPR